MNSEDAAACIQAALLMPKVGRKTVRKIFDDLPEEVSDRSSFRDHLVRIGGSFPRVPSTTEEEVRELFEEADELIAKTTKFEKGSVLSMFDFPDRLKRMDDPPVLLHCLGDRSLLEGKSAAVIGTRNPTDYGREAALAFGRLLADPRQRASEVSSVQSPAFSCPPKAPPLMSETGSNEPGSLNSTGAPNASPAASPKTDPRNLSLDLSDFFLLINDYPNCLAFLTIRKRRTRIIRGEVP